MVRGPGRIGLGFQIFESYFQNVRRQEKDVLLFGGRLSGEGLVFPPALTQVPILVHFFLSQIQISPAHQTSSGVSSPGVEERGDSGARGLNALPLSPF